jgi:hypothetical protein
MEAINTTNFKDIETCPGCNAKFSEKYPCYGQYWVKTFECFSHVSWENDGTDICFRESGQCLRNQISQLKAKIQELENE